MSKVLEEDIQITPLKAWWLHHCTHFPGPCCDAVQAFIATLLFDPSMSALPIIVKPDSPSVSSSFA